MPKRYSQQDLLDATDSVRQGILSLRKASKRYGVPVMTIQDRVRGNVDDVARAGRPTVIPEEVEAHIVEKLKQASEQGFGITPRMVRVRVGRIVRRLKMKTPFKAGIPGKDWMTAFIKRHPDISLRSPAPLSTVRAKMLNDVVVSKYFDCLKEIFDNLDLSGKPSPIWNIDETSVPLTHKPSKVLASTGAKNIPGRVGNCRDNVSVLACVNAAGGEIPPMVIVKGKTYKSLHAYNTDEGVPGSIYTYQEKAWMEDVQGEQWFQDHFLKLCGEERPQLIILDSHSSHETLGFIELCIKNDIALLAFPPHTTQWLCPLDKTIFGPLSREYSAVCTEFMANSPNNMVRKWEWPKLFRLAHDRAFTKTNIMNGFKKCGIYPLDKSALPVSATAPSRPFNVDLHNASSLVSVQTEQLPLSPKAATPATAQFDQCEAESAVCALTSMSSATVSVPSVEQPTPAALTFLTEHDLLQSVLSGSVPFTMQSDGVIDVQLPVADSEFSLVPSVSDLTSQVDDVFQLPVADRQVKASSKKLTAHRLLTSHDIYEKRLEVKLKKESEIRIKEKRKMDRQMKKAMKMEKKGE